MAAMVRQDWIRLTVVLAFGTALLAPPARAQESKPEPAKPGESKQEPAKQEPSAGAAPAGQSTAEKPKSNEKLPPAAEILAKFVEKTGGEKAYRKHTSRHAKGTFEMKAAGMNAEMEAFAAKPNKALIRINLPGMGLNSVGFDGKVGWGNNPMTGPSLMEGPQLEQLRLQSEFYMDVEKAKHFKTIETVDVTEFEGKKCFQLKLTPASGPSMYEFYDVETGLRNGLKMTATTDMGDMEVTVIESDYKQIDDVLMAMTTVQRVGDIQEIAIKLTSVEFDKVEDAVFGLPAEIKALLAEKAEKKDEKKSDVP